MWFKNLKFFELQEAINLDSDTLKAALETQAYQPCGPGAAQSFGWVNPMRMPQQEHLFYQCEGFTLLCIRIEKKILPAQVVREQLAEAIQKIELRDGRKVYKREKEALKEEIYQSLLLRAFSTSSYLFGFIDSLNQRLCIDSTQAAQIDLFTSLLRESFGSLKLQLPTLANPIYQMTNWILDQNIPADIGLSDSCMLQHPDKESGSVRISKQELQAETIQSFIRNEHFYVKELAISWQAVLNAILKEDGSMRQIRFSDEVHSLAKDIQSQDAKERFASDFVVMAKTLRELINRTYQIFAPKEASITT